MGILSTVRKVADKTSDALRSVGTTIFKKVTGDPSTSSTGGGILSGGSTTTSSSGTFGGSQGTGFTSTGGGVTIPSSGGGSSGGGGSGGGTSTTQSASGVTQQPITTYDPARDVPVTRTPSYSGVVSAGTTGPRTGFSSAQRILKDESGQFKGKPLQRLYEAGKTLFKKSKEPIERVIQNVEEKATRVVEGAYPSTYKTRAYEEQVENFNKKSSDLEKDVETFNKKYGDRELPSEEYNKALTEEATIKARVERRNAAAENLTARGIEVEKMETKTIESASKAATKAIVGAVFFIPKLIVSPIKTTKETVVGLAETPQALVTAPGPTIGGIVGGIAAFYVGGKVVGRLAYGKQVDPVKLNSALETAEVKVKSSKGVTQESQLKVFKISEADKTQLGKDINLGHSVRATEYEITHRSPIQRKIIQEGLPKVKITSIEVLDNVGNVISRKTIQAVEVKKGIFKYKDYTVGRGVGVYNLETGIAEIDSIYARGKQGKPIGEAFKEKEVIKVEQPIYKRVDEGYLAGDIIRMTKARSVTFEGVKKVGTKQQPVTYKDLSEVIQSEKFGRFPKQKTISGEIQSLRKLKFTEANIEIIPEQIIEITGREKIFKVEAGVGKTVKFQEPIEFKYSKAMKPFEEPKIKAIEIKQPTQPRISKQQSQVLKEIEKSTRQFDVGQLPQIDLSKQIIKSVKSVAKQIKYPKIKSLSLSQGRVNKELQRVYEKSGAGTMTSQITLQKQLEGQENIVTPPPIQKPRGRTRQRDIVIPAQIQLLSPAQINKQIEKLIQIQPTKFMPPTVIPRFNLPKPITPFIPFPSSGQGGGSQQYKRFQRKAKKAQSDYTASLVAAAVQVKPFKVTRKQYARLKKGTYTGIEVRPVLEIVDEKDIRKNLRKVDFGI